MRIQTKVVVADGMSFVVAGVPTLSRRAGLLTLGLGGSHMVNLDVLPIGTEVAMALVGFDGTAEDRDMARLTRTESGVSVERADGTATLDSIGADRSRAAFEPHVVDVSVDGVVIETIALGDGVGAAGVAFRALDALMVDAGPSAAGTYDVRPAPRLPRRTRPSTLRRLAAA